MSPTPLENAAWGFVSNCFVCEPGNASGLGLAFFHDHDADLVYAELTLGAAFSGPPHYVHGGLVLTVMDEAMAWGAIALGGSFALTRSITARFARPVRVGEPHRAEARLVARSEGGDLTLSASVADAAGRTCARAEAVFVPMSPAQAQAAIGDVAGDDAGFVRGRPPPPG